MNPLELLGEAWAEAAAASGSESCDYLIGRRPVRIRVAGAELAAQTHEIFRHLRSESAAAEPALCIDYWDAEATGVPKPSGARAALELLGRSWQMYEGSFHASRNGRILAVESIGLLTCLDRKAGHAASCTVSEGELTLNARSRPFHPVFNVWLSDAGIHPTHAGCSAVDGHAALLGGRSGSGKSTASLACLLDGLDFLSDDCVGLERQEDGSFVAHSLYGSACLDDSQTIRFPELSGLAASAQGFQERQFLTVSRSEHSRMAREARICVILLPRFGGKRGTRAERVSPAEALLAMAPNSVLGMRPAPGRMAFERLSELVQRLPAYRLETGTDLRELGQRVRELISRHATN